MFRITGRPVAAGPRAAALAALALTTALVAVSAMAPHAAAFADPGYSGGTNPEYTGKGASAVKESVCGQWSNGAGQCGFLTANGDRFLVGLPKGFVAKYQGTTAGTVDNMAVIAAMVRLPAAKYAPANISGVPSGLSVAPAYAALLAKVGVTPTQFLDWQMGNVPPDQRLPWEPGWAPTGAATTTTTGTVTTPPTTTTKTTPPTTKTPTASGTKAAPASGTKAASGTSSATRSVSTVTPPVKVTPTAATSESLASKSIHKGQAVANPTFCSKASSWVWNPAGDRCMPDTLLGVAPSAKPGTVVTVTLPRKEGGKAQQARLAAIQAQTAARLARDRRLASQAWWGDFRLVVLFGGIILGAVALVVASLRGLRTP